MYVHNSNDCEKEVTAANTTAMSRKLKKMLNDSKEQLLSKENVKRRKRNCRTPDDDIHSKTDLSLDCNRNNVNFTKHGIKSSMSEADSKTGLCEDSHNVTKTEIDEKELKNLDPFQRELIVKGLGKRDRVPEIKGSRGQWEKSQSMMHYFQQFAYGAD